ncbi:FAD-dependent oxidoreductase [Spectribacter hydrogenooxidans]|uniref:FAD-dependent oxidoreductase n=1 Tax=Spectribacter hydrogenoxidans TaxID=3075608 RepID=A0ABU3BYQ2_9GAMM|nr:FAD-dependent oxidoreductase [Salinisphaera sp. W335]MDT0634385.1 FAD-dependent oxidoreductase [Salinisphaera sp. W335]
MILTRLLLVTGIAGLLTAWFLLDPGRWLGGACEGQLFSLACLDAQRGAIEGLRQEMPLLLAAGFFAVYVLVAALSIPGAAVMTLATGAVFGLGWGLLIVSFASSVGATLAFLTARFLLRDGVQRRFGRRLAAINRGVEKDGAFYLFALRLVPAFPFFVINLAMGLTPIRMATFYFVSQIGMLPGTVVYVNAGTQLGQVESLGGILSPGLIGSFVLLGLFPLVARKGLEWFRSRQALRGYRRPVRFDRNLIVIGAGSGGLVAAYIAAAVKAKVTLIERDRMGGDCLNTGCVPSKALLRTARFLYDVKCSGDFGVHTASADFDFAQVMDRVREVVRRIEPHDSVERYEGLGVECLQGSARLVDPWTVELDDGRRLSARAIVLATGAQPVVPPIEGIDSVAVLTSDNLWELQELPGRLVVLGGGPIGCEMTQAFARLGSRVTQVEMLDRLMMPEDPEIAASLRQRLEAEGVAVRTGHRAVAVRLDDGRQVLVCEHGGETVEIEFDRLLVAVGRAARLQGFGLEDLGIEADRTIGVNEFLQTTVPTIYACGDAIAPYQFTHVAAHEAWFAAVNGLFGTFRKFRVDYSVIPWVTFTDPEIAHVGHNETSAASEGIEYEVTTYGIDDLDRAITDSDARGVVKVLTEPGTDRVIGATIMGPHAGELIAEFVTAMKQGIGLNKILGTIHAYPTYVEANKFAAGEWKRAHAPAWALALLSRLHAWRL